MRKTLLFTALLFVLSVNASLKAQQVLDLKTCIQIAIENNLLVKQAENLEEVAEGQYLQRKVAFAPNLNASINLNRGIGRQVDNFSQSIANSPTTIGPALQSSLTLYSGMVRWNSMKSAEFSLEAARLSIKRVQNELQLSVMVGYYQVLLDKANLEVIQTRINLFEKQQESAEKQYRAGILTEGDVLNLKAQIASEKVNLVNQKNLLDRDIVNLVQLLNLDPGLEYEIRAPEPGILNTETELPDLTAVFDFAQYNQPQMKEQEMTILSNKYLEKAARGASQPSLAFSYSAGSFYSSNARPILRYDIENNLPVPVFGDAPPIFTQIGDNFGQQVGLSLIIPIFNNFSVRQSVLRAHANYENAKLEYQNRRNELYRTIRVAWLDMRSSMTTLEASGEQLTATEEALMYAQKKYDAGLLDFYSYLEVLNTQSNAEMQANTARFDFLLKRSVLDFYQGKEIDY